MNNNQDETFYKQDYLLFGLVILSLGMWQSLPCDCSLFHLLIFLVAAQQLPP